MSKPCHLETKFFLREFQDRLQPTMDMNRNVEPGYEYEGIDEDDMMTKIVKKQKASTPSAMANQDQTEQLAIYLLLRGKARTQTQYQLGLQICGEMAMELEFLSPTSSNPEDTIGQDEQEKTVQAGRDQTIMNKQKPDVGSTGWELYNLIL
ncbi:hypothetical protein QQP08_008494 [Theobroma cacao]|nr:hypothetical protein QQP08_008494 [Theobroma cacao]